MLATVLALALLAAPAADQLPDQPSGRCLYDPTGAIDASSAEHLESACEALDRSGDAQLEIAVVPDLGDMDRDEYANELFKKWQIGHKGRDDGLLVLLKTGSVGHRDFKIEVGYGLEGALPDGKVVEKAREIALPDWSRGRYGAGLVPYVDWLIAEAKKEAATGGVERRAQLQKQQDSEVETALGTGFGLFLALLAWAGLFLAFGIGKHLPGKPIRTAGTLLLGGGALAALVEGGQFKGQLLVAWAICSGLGALAYFAVVRHRCPKCGHWKTIDSKIIREPTYWSDGEALIVEACTSCDYRNRYRKAIARKTRTVYIGGGGGGWGGGGGGGGGGGFSGGGGGSSGGGGGGFGF